MKQRIFTAVMLIGFLALVLFSKSITPYIFDAFTVMLACFAGYEMSMLLNRMGMYNNKLVISLYPILSYGLYKLAILQNVEFSLIIVMQVALAALLAVIITIYSLIAKNKTDNEIKTRKLKTSVNQFAIFKGIQTFFGILYPGFIVMLLFVINNLGEFGETFVKFASYNMEISYFMLALTFLIPVVVDTFAMLTGSLFKGKKLCPSISPNKTISGAIGGFIWGVLGSLAIYFIFNATDTFRLIFADLNLAWWKVMIVGIIASILCQLGDLFESYLKRKANVKDSGDFLPGHGGILDRIDSHIVSIVIVFIFMLVL
ncbi:MAG: phosphatidate cytidylyltransferase [Clostridia bacterium]|nr:phosphatidate cytidylyltransferase [Clostridia bacterium]